MGSKNVWLCIVDLYKCGICPWTEIKCVFIDNLCENLFWQTKQANFGSTPHSNLRCRHLAVLLLYDLPHKLGHSNLISLVSETNFFN